MYFKYGSFQFEDGEAVLGGFTRRMIRSAQDLAIREERVLSVGFQIVRNTQANIRSRYNAIYAALAVENQTAGWYHDDDSASAVYLPNQSDDGNNLTGVLVMERPSIRPADGADYATHLDGQLVLRAEYRISGAPGLVDFSETVSVEGSGGPNIVAVPQDSGPPQLIATTFQTPVLVVQEGQAVGLNTWPAPQPPYYPNELAGARRISRRSPRRRGGGLTDYPVSWSYRFVLTGPTAGYPALG